MPIKLFFKSWVIFEILVDLDNLQGSFWQSICQTADSTVSVRTSKEPELKGLKTMRKFKIFFARFCLLCSSCAFFVLCYYKVIFRPFNSGSFDIQTDNGLSAVW